MRISLSGVTGDSIVDGPGLRLTIFTQGCLHHCPGCHNPQTHDPEGGSWADTEDILAAAAENPLLDGITLSGGDPFLQPVPCLALAEGAHKIGLNVWTYTGYTWEALLEENDAEKLALLKETDVLVDGPFLLAERSLELRFCGSRNQRLIDVKKSLAEDKVVLWEEPSYF
ncbi:anaerobic ribonucleoside-triphosphate reductase activating protein [Firmicutes bacterium AM29-6AC]|uniref:Anaerobic ribonucleoside-triphosphate reductase-activating protein n=1 Tax=Anaerotignum faecicola TaxID=2358141 RepID=A0A401LBC8_9FIRM|nr:anaerobic ribonucleoside-triphosphate reductase activating protein [Anaerotignum faecicola]RHR16882.1 anaerobic ribonucleoside-triphosphate reductase activating protein [Firmicutes bacterium AF19-2LB]RHT41181.1 anaerobic ribonucleoside-triphosphate reductase activating protein [Firmicutes bacterium AM29-6AC]GCB28881.1 anaerobic ribonucleoside-triphosphate reductase activating protein [Anaerotignum faecicola]HBD88265.1 anaerobic ribonucleoside-triphosphate reductase activating protein [Tyzzer